MATAGTVVEGALKYCQFQDVEEPVSAADLADGIEILNDMMASWYEDGIRIGFRPVSASGDFISAPSTAILAIKQNLAMQMGPLFRASDSPVNPGLATAAERSLRQLRNKCIKMRDAPYPSTLPMGSGNTFYSDYVQNFYIGEDLGYVQMQFQDNTTPQSLTANTPAKLNISTWVVKEAVGFSATTGGVITYKTDGIAEVWIKASVLFQGSGSSYPGSITLYPSRGGEYIKNAGVTQAVPDISTERRIDFEYGPMGVTKADPIQLFVETTADAVIALSGYLEVRQCA